MPCNYTAPAFTALNATLREYTAPAFTALNAELCSSYYILFDASSNGGYTAASNTDTWSHTCSGDDRFLVVGVAMLSLAQTVSGITYNGVALTLIGVRSSVTGAARVELWGLIAPATGANNIVVTLTGSIAFAGVASSYNNVHQTVPTEGFNSAQATNVGAADATVNVTTVADNDWTVDIVCTDDTAITVGAGQISRANVTGAGGSGAMSSEGTKTPAGSVTMSWTDVGALMTWAIGSVALRPVSAASGATYEDAFTLAVQSTVSFSAPQIVFGPSLTFSVSKSLSISSQHVMDGGISFGVQNNLTMTGGFIFDESFSFSVQNAAQFSANLSINGNISFATQNSMALAGQMAMGESLSFSVQNSISSIGNMVMNGAIGLSAAGGMTGAAGMEIPGSVSLGLGQGASASGSVVFSTSMTLSIQSGMIVSANAVMGGLLSFNWAGSLLVSSAGIDDASLGSSMSLILFGSAQTSFTLKSSNDMNIHMYEGNRGSRINDDVSLVLRGLIE